MVSYRWIDIIELVAPYEVIVLKKVGEIAAFILQVAQVQIGGGETMRS